MDIMSRTGRRMMSCYVEEKRNGMAKGVFGAFNGAVYPYLDDRVQDHACIPFFVGDVWRYHYSEVMANYFCSANEFSNPCVLNKACCRPSRKFFEVPSCLLGESLDHVPIAR